MSEQVKDLNEKEAQAWRALHRAQSHLDSSIDKQLAAAHGLGLPDYQVLSHLASARQHSARMSELASDVLLSPSGLTRRLDGLVKSGLVERAPCPSDGRGALAVLTDAGQAKLTEMQPTHIKVTRELFFDRVNDDQLDQVVEILGGIAVGSSATS